MEKIGAKPIDGEIWKDLLLDDIQERYSISNYGRVYDNKNYKLMSWLDNGNGYKIVGLLGPKSKVRIRYVHRLVAKLFIDNSNNHPQVGHLDHNKENNNFSNLYWCTQKQNTKDGIDAGRINNKKRGNVNRLIESDYKSIATLCKNGLGVNEIAIQLGFPRTTISSVLNGRSRWSLFQQFMC